MKKIALFSLMVVAVLGMMTSRAQSDDNWDVNVNIVNSAETPVMLSLANNNDAHATFPGGGSTCILQPGQSTVLYAMNNHPLTTASIQWNIIYNFYDGTDSINQRISSEGYMSGPNVNCALPSQSDLFSVSAGTYVDTTFTDYDTGDAMASWMGLSGTADKIVGGLIDLGLKLAGFDPQQSTTSNYFYSITIGQNDYNTDKLAHVDWSSFQNVGLPSVTFIKGQQVFQYVDLATAWSNTGNLVTQSTIADFSGSNASIGLNDGYVANYGVNAGTYQILNTINFPGYTHNVVQISRNPNSPEFMAVFDDSSLWYSDGVNTYSLAGSVGSAVLQLRANWGGSRNGANWPQTVLGLANGGVWYFNGSSWSVLGTLNSSIMHVEAFWDDTSNLQLVAGLGNGDLNWWTGSDWRTLYDPTGFAPVYQLSARFTAGGVTQPQVLATFFDGSAGYYANSIWTTISQPGNYCIIDVAPANFTFPTFLAGFSDGHVDVYDGASTTWYEVQPNRPGNRVQFLSGNWDQLDPSEPSYNVPYVYSCNYQFTYNVYYRTNVNYPAIPDVSSACGDIDGDGKADLISVEGSNWYVWYSSNQYSTRYGPYDLGVFGKPVIGDIDGDGKGDLIMVKGSHWYAWTSSSGYTNRIDLDLGIYGRPLTGDIDGDGKDDLIMVMGSIWYAWTSSSGYKERLGPYDLGGTKGLSAAGDIDGDGKADLVIAIGPNWYTWSSASKYQVRSGPYNMGISGIPKLADIDGDGLADPIVIVGSDWYVWFSSAGYQRFGPYTMNLP
jgi:FG-GAP-like repeat